MTACRRLFTAILILLTAGCDRAPAERPEWVIHSRLVFFSDDLRQERAPLAPDQFRLLFRYISGDLYGAPTTGDFVRPVPAPKDGFTIDLNRTHAALLASLEKTDFSLSYLHIDPPDARVARLAPELLQADGIEQVGRLDWLDPRTQQTLLLLYVDRPASITGRFNGQAGALRYAIRTTAADYVWVGREALGSEAVYSVRPRPAEVLLAVRPIAAEAPRLQRSE